MMVSLEDRQPVATGSRLRSDVAARELGIAEDALLALHREGLLTRACRSGDLLFLDLAELRSLVVVGRIRMRSSPYAAGASKGAAR